MMVRIKVLCGLFKSSMPPTRIDGRYEFIYDPNCSEYDWLVVFDEMPVTCEELRCPREQTILCTWEPVSIKSYSRAYTRQFGHLLTNRPPDAEKHSNYHLGRGYFLWFVHDIPPVNTVVDKPKSVSVVCSAKQMKHTKHHARFELVSKLASVISEMDWYGKGVKPLARKEDALIPYKYHVAIENHIAPHHWTEKFSDAILCESLPFYAGDPALAEIFPEACFIPIPIDDPEAAVRIVKAAIANDEYAKRREAILKAKRLILTKYNFWNQIIGVVEDAAIVSRSEDAPLAVGPSGVFGVGYTGSVIYARREMRKHSLFALLEDGWEHLLRIAGSRFGIMVS